MSENARAITQNEIGALKRFLKWLRGFGESPLYEDYKEHEKFTDEEYAQTLATLEGLASAPTDPPYCPSCGEPLNALDYTAYDLYKFDPETKTYKEDGYGEASVQCKNCGCDLTDEPEFENGPLNYKPQVSVVGDVNNELPAHAL